MCACAHPYPAETITHIYNNTRTGSRASIIAPAEFQNYAGISFSDLAAFTSIMGVPSFNLSYVYGAFVGAGDESSLDVQYAGAVGPANTLYYWCVCGVCGAGGHTCVCLCVCV